MSGLPYEVDPDPTNGFYTTNEPIESLKFLDRTILGSEAYNLSPLVMQINSEVRFPKGRLPSDIYHKFMTQINKQLPICVEKREHRFKHARLRVHRTMKEKIAGRPKSVMTSQCIYCKADWTGLRYPLEEDERFPPQMSLWQHRRQDSNKGERPRLSPEFLDRVSSNSSRSGSSR